jgi:hypothetical protein
MTANNACHQCRHLKVASMTKALCGLVMASVRRIGVKGEVIGMNSSSMALSFRQATQLFGQSIAHSDA